MKNVALFAFILLFGLASCKSDDSDIRAQAKESLENKTVVNPGTSGLMAAQTSEGNHVTGALTSIEFETKRYKFEPVVSGEKVKTTFKFTNTGDEPLLISDVKTSCGCTASSYPKEPVAPGESAEIEAVFDTSGKSGAQTKNITVMTNTDPSSNVLIIEGVVERKTTS